MAPEAAAISNTHHAAVKAAPEVCKVWESHESNPKDTYDTSLWLAGNNAAREDYCQILRQ